MTNSASVDELLGLCLDAVQHCCVAAGPQELPILDARQLLCTEGFVLIGAGKSPAQCCAGQGSGVLVARLPSNDPDVVRFSAPLPVRMSHGLVAGLEHGVYSVVLVPCSALVERLGSSAVVLGRDVELAPRELSSRHMRGLLSGLLPVVMDEDEAGGGTQQQQQQQQHTTDARVPSQQGMQPGPGADNSSKAVSINTAQVSLAEADASHALTSPAAVAAAAAAAQSLESGMGTASADRASAGERTRVKRVSAGVPSTERHSGCGSCGSYRKGTATPTAGGLQRPAVPSLGAGSLPVYSPSQSRRSSYDMARQQQGLQVFATADGVSACDLPLSGASMGPDEELTLAAYGPGVAPADILHGKVPWPPAFDPLAQFLASIQRMPALPLFARASCPPALAALGAALLHEEPIEGMTPPP